MNVQRLVDSVAYIPHLDLGVEFDVGKLVHEFARLKPEIFQPYRSTVPHIADKIAKSWLGVSLYSPDGSLHSDLSENKENMSGQCQPTPLTDLCPYMYEVIDTLGGARNRARLMLVTPGGQLTWHSHIFDGVDDFRPWIIVCHVPILAPAKFRYSVISLADMRLGDHERTDMVIHTTNYPPGRANVFNSVHYHNIFNDSDHLRASIMMYLDLNNEKTFNLVDRAIANYTGPWIER